MLRYDIRTLRHGSLTTEETVEPGAPVFDGLGVELAGPVSVRGVLRAAGTGTYVWQGTVAGSTRGQCRRCLTEVESPFQAEVEAVFTTAPEAADDPAVYPLAEPVTAVDLTEAVREEVGLAVSAYPLCRDECAGLCPRCGENRNEGPCACARSPEPV